MIKRTPLFPFENQMSRTQTILGWIYLPIHVLLLPLLLPLLNTVLPTPMDEGGVNLAYYCVGIVFALTVMLGYLRRSFDLLLDRLRYCLLVIVLTFMINYALSTAATLVLALFEAALDNPNNAQIMDIAGKSYGAIVAVTVFLAPIVEEILFRGVVFGSLHRRSRALAYVVSVGLFSLYHVWQYAVAYGDARMLLYMLQYIPISFALTWAYERSGSIWTTILFHMGYNALSFYLLNLMEQLA